jgi:hypothetical protein
VGNASVTIKVNEKASTNVSVRGHEEDIANLAEQLVWLTSTLRASTSPELKSSSALIRKESDGDEWRYSINVKPLEALRVSEAGCWISLFQNCVISVDSLIPSRSGGRGLEVSFDNLISLSGADDFLDREGRLIIVGPSTILIPIEIFPDGSIQWHLVNSYALDRLQKYENIIGRSIFPTEDVAEFPQTSHDSNTQATTLDNPEQSYRAFVGKLRSCRHFLGWCEYVNVTLGTSSARYEVCWTAAEEERYTKTKSSQTATGGVSIKGILTGSLSRTWNIRDNRNPRFPLADKSDNLRTILDSRAEEHVILYDPDEKRAWMVPYLSVLLHIVIVRIKRRRYKVQLHYADSVQTAAQDRAQDRAQNGAEAAVQDRAQGAAQDAAQNGAQDAAQDATQDATQDTAEDAATTARDTLLRNRALNLAEDDSNEPYLVEEVIKLLDRALQNALPIKAKPKILGTTLFGTTLFGNELMDLVLCEAPFRTRKKGLEISHGGWTKLTKNVQIVLFCQGLGDVLQPDPSHVQRCANCATVPAQHDYLAASVKGITHLWERRLLHGFTWQLTENSFDPCPGAQGSCCRRLQRLDWAKFSVNHGVEIPPNLGDFTEGAVIFGRPSKATEDYESIDNQNRNAHQSTMRPQPDNVSSGVNAVRVLANSQPLAWPPVNTDEQE